MHATLDHATLRTHDLEGRRAELGERRLFTHTQTGLLVELVVRAGDPVSTKERNA